MVREEGNRLLLPEVAEQAAMLLLRQGAREQAIDLWHAAQALRRTAGLPRLPGLLRWYGDRTAALAMGSADLPPGSPDSLSARIAALVPAGP